MGQAIGNTLPLAFGVAVSPVPIIAIVLMLGTPRARATGPAFALGWVTGLTLVGTITLLIATGNETAASGQPKTWASVVKLVLGVLLIGLAVREWSGRPKAGESAQLPKWMQTVDTFTAGKALGLGALLAGANPKNLGLTIAAGLVIAQAGISTGQEAGALAVFVLVGSLSILAPLFIYLAMGEKAKVILEELKLWLGVHNSAIMAVLLMVLGLKLVGDAIAALST